MHLGCFPTIFSGLLIILKKLPSTHSCKPLAFHYIRILKKAFKYQKTEVKNSIVYAIDEIILFTVETAASIHIIAAALNQSSRSITFFPLPVNKSTLLYKKKPKQ